MKKLIILLLVVCCLIAGCKWDAQVHSSRYSGIEKFVMDHVDTHWDDSVTDPIVKVMLGREDVPAKPFGDMENLIATIEKSIIKWNEENDRSLPTFKNYLSEKDYVRIMEDNPYQQENPFTPKVATKETVNDQYLAANRIGFLLSEVKDCTGASNLLQRLLREKKFLTLQDEQDVMVEINYCKTVDLMHEVK